MPVTGIMKTMNRNVVRGLLALGVSAAAGCGRAPAQGGGPEGVDFPITAVCAPAVLNTEAASLELIATLEAREAVQIVSETAGTVQAIHFREGGPVAEGDLLATLKDAKIVAERDEARARFDLARQDYERSERLMESETISAQEHERARSAYDAAEAALRRYNEQVNDTKIVAPFAGVVGERLVDPGQYVARGDPLARLANPNPLEVRFDVPERYAGRVAIDQAVHVVTTAFADEVFSGAVTYVAPVVRDDTRTITVKAEVANPEGRLKPGMFGRVALEFARDVPSLTVPDAAVIQQGSQASVIKRNGEGKAEMQPVTVGSMQDGRAEIVSGLAEGDLVVVEGTQKIFPGTTIAIAPESERYGVVIASGDGTPNIEH